MNINYMLQMLAKQNPQVAQMLNSVNNGQITMEQLCRNLCKQKGLDFNTIVEQAKHQQNENNGSRQPY